MRNIFFITLALVSLTGYSQLKISGVLRPRMEYRNGYGTLRDSLSTMALFVGQRTRLSMNYKKENLTTGITLYDFRIWGDQKLKADAPSIGVLEAWAEISLSETSSIKAGRQILRYDNNRLISPVNWNQNGAAHDALLFKFRKSGWILDIGLAFNQTSQNTFGTDYSLNNYKTLDFLWLNKKINNFDIAMLSLTDGNQKENSENTIYLRTTNGFVFKYKQNKLQLENRAFYQAGKTKTGQNIAAWYQRTDIIYNYSKKLKTTLGLETMSGNDATDTLNNTYNAFDIVIGGRHKFNGRMDYYSIPSKMKHAGLNDLFFILKYKIDERISIMPEYHYFMLQNNYVFNNNTVDKFLGHEIDLTFDFNISKEVNLQAGYSVMLATETTEIIKGGDKNLLNNWFFMMLTVKPVFFESE